MLMGEEKTYRDLLPVIVEREKATLPEGCDSWGIKSVHPDLRTRNNYQWPLPGGVATCDPDRIIHDNMDARPDQVGDGLCIARTWRAMASGFIPARTMLLVAYASKNILGSSVHWLDNGNKIVDKLRVSEVHVVALVDGQRLLREQGKNANLYGANLRGMELRYADLRSANLYRADLRGASLRGASLRGASLHGAMLPDWVRKEQS